MALIDTNAVALAALVAKVAGDTYTAVEYSTLLAALKEANAKTRPMNTVLAGPTSGADAAAAFRGLGTADIPDLSGTYASAAALATNATADRARANHTGSQLAATISDLPETVRDTIGSALVAGSNITVTVNDPGDTITIAAAAGVTYPALVVAEATIDLGVASGSAGQLIYKPPAGYSFRPFQYNFRYFPGMTASVSGATVRPAVLSDDGGSYSLLAYLNAAISGITIPGSTAAQEYRLLLTSGAGVNVVYDDSGDGGSNRVAGLFCTTAASGGGDRRIRVSAVGILSVI